ncbi:MAG: hypothetical protein H6555_08895, partial [Lewinellaceae bacterium]|nr:hypothetical protein [Lewinellaceae bacterium]
FQAVMEDAAEKPLGDFFQQWLYQPGQPELKFSWSYDEKKHLLHLKLEQNQPGKFVFPVEFAALNAAGEVMATARFICDTRSADWVLPLPQSPARVDLDPNTRLLFRLVK